MRNTFQAIATAVTMLVLVGTVKAQQPGAAAGAEKPRTQQFGLTTKELEQTIEKVEALIAKYMREAGFEYLACDVQTVKKGMSAHKSLPGVSDEQFIGKFDVELLSQLRRPGVSEEEFIGKYGFGLSTWYTGKAPQLAEGYSPTREGLGQRNIQIFKKLSAADQVKYNRALFGENTDASFAVGLEIENFSRCGGCTRKAIEQVFKPEQLKPNYVNPQAARIKNHPMMTTALRVYANAMREEGLAYKHPDEVEADIRERLNVLTKRGTIPVDKMSAEQLADLKKLQDYERKVAMKNFELQKNVFGRIEEQIEFLLAK